MGRRPGLEIDADFVLRVVRAVLRRGVLDAREFRLALPQGARRGADALVDHFQLVGDGVPRLAPVRDVEALLFDLHVGGRCLGIAARHGLQRLGLFDFAVQSVDLHAQRVRARRVLRVRGGRGHVRDRAQIRAEHADILARALDADAGGVDAPRHTLQDERGGAALQIGLESARDDGRTRMDRDGVDDGRNRDLGGRDGKGQGRNGHGKNCSETAHGISPWKAAGRENSPCVVAAGMNEVQARREAGAFLRRRGGEFGRGERRYRGAREPRPYAR